MELHLDETEVDLLRSILDREYRDSRMEIADTDNSRFKEELRGRNARVRAILDRLGGPLPD
ncbi:MAG: hypothetical protein MUE34_10680 [Acidimicrobiales bacterium]|jgi:hypothetical protein|nr:hypothetical protein [Acidimicrobiales bacterium]